jgi:acetylglutamate kinase
MKPPVVVKIGGALLEAPDSLEAFWTALSTLRQQAPVVLVHGGGPQATALAQQLGHTPHIVQGRRVTTALDLQILQWTLRGELNLRLVAAALRHGLPAVGLAAADGGMLRVKRRPQWTIEGKTVDFGFVGDVEQVDPTLLHHLLSGGYMPVVAPLGMDLAGQLYNVNADTVACTLAGALQANTFLLVTETGGVRRNPSDPNSLLSYCDMATFEAGVQAGWISGGMRVKLEVAFQALQTGIPEVYILSPQDLVQRQQATRVIA